MALQAHDYHWPRSKTFKSKWRFLGWPRMEEKRTKNWGLIIFLGSPRGTCITLSHDFEWLWRLWIKKSPAGKKSLLVTKVQITSDAVSEDPELFDVVQHCDDISYSKTSNRSEIDPQASVGLPGLCPWFRTFLQLPEVSTRRLNLCFHFCVPQEPKTHSKIWKFNYHRQHKSFHIRLSGSSTVSLMPVNFPW